MPQVVERRSKRYKKAGEKPIVNPVPVDQAIDALKAFPPTKFDQSVEVIFSLGIDPKHADQMIRSSVSLPHGVGKSKRVIAFVPAHLADAAKAAGAIKAGAKELVEEIEKTNFTDFDVAIASPDMMPSSAGSVRCSGPRA